jgi:3-oxoacyl-[acyl-carrier-protein] synthase-1
VTDIRQRPCELAALGIVNALGGDRHSVWSRLRAGDRSGFQPRDGFLPERAMLVAEVRTPLPAIPAGLGRYDCRNNSFTLAAFEQIEDPVRDVVKACGRDRVGVVMGTSTSGSAECEAAILHEVKTGELLPSFRYPMLEFGATSGFLAELLELRGPAFSLSTACSSSARALASARSLIALGLCDAVLAGGSDSLCGLTTNGFASLQAVSAEASNPMSANRRGLTLGEGAALFLVTRTGEGIQLLGIGESSEAHHMSAPDPEGGGATVSMRGALSDAGLDASDILYLNLHGTGTKLNDAMESLAVARVFGCETPCSSTKSLVGHTLGAAGAMELAFLWLMLDERRRSGSDNLELPPHCFDGVRDPELEPIRLASKGERVAARGRNALLSNSFGFGGNNCTLIVGEGAAC